MKQSEGGLLKGVILDK
jgi:ATPase family AAA domain-containing protein 3A/B